MNEALASLYQRCCSTPSDIYEHLPTFVAACEELQAKTVIELGVRHGISTIAWLYGLERTGGHLWSVDCSFPTAGPEMPDVNLLDPQGPLGVVPWWTFVLGQDEWESTRGAIPIAGDDGHFVDILFVDSQHTYEQTMLECELYLPWVSRAYFHDTMLETTGNAVTPQPPYPVRTAIEEFCGRYSSGEYTFTNDERCNGLGRVDVR